MIKINKKPIKYAALVKVSRECMNDTNVINSLANRNRKPKLPKNTLRITKKRCDVGYCGDDFIRDVVSIRFEYSVITFKR